MNEEHPLNYELVQALELYFESEAAFGMDVLPGGARLAPVANQDLTAKLSGDSAPDSAHLTPTLARLALEIANCRACELCRGRNKSVPGQGAERARLMFVGEAPGAEEDRLGLAFIGPAGQLLTKMIEAMGLSRDDVFIANVLKCRPPGNRNPQPLEVKACGHFLRTQIQLVEPDLIVALGAYAARNLLQSQKAIGKLRGQVHPFEGRKLVATYHPSYLLRTPSAKRAAWADLQLVMKELDITPSDRD